MQHIRTKEGRLIVWLAAGLSGLSLFFMYGDGFFAGYFGDGKTGAMLGEMLILFLLLCCVGQCLSSEEHRAGAILFVVSAFLWVHRIFLPVIVSGVWMLGLSLMGEALLFVLRSRTGQDSTSPVMRFAQNFLVGASFYIAAICTLSLFRIGGVASARRTAVFLVLLAVLCLLLFSHSGMAPICYECLGPETGALGRNGRTGDSEEPDDGRLPLGKQTSCRRFGPLRLAVLTLLLLQAGRMNVALDYDSLRYGLRSQYILDRGAGIYEALGTVNTVYVYPKGLEILTLPLSGTVTYGLVLAFSWWCAVLLLFVIREIAADCAGSQAGEQAMFLAACIPGILNLSISAKTDMITLLFQMMAILFMLESGLGSEWDRGTESRWRLLIWGLLSLLMTLCFKPTALVFSGGLLLAAMQALIGTRLRRGGDGNKEAPDGRRKRTAIGHGMMLPSLLTGIAFLGVTGRTLVLTGYPLASVFTGIWERMGLRGHYPLAVQTLPNAVSGLSGSETITRLFYRLFLLLLSPVGEEGLHIRVAWGTPLFLLCLLSVMLFRFGKKEKRRKETGAVRFVETALFIQILLGLISLRLLHQIDGNYYNLSYALAAIGAAAAAPGRKESAAVCCLPAVLTAILFMGLTNWAGVNGLTEPKLNHYGFYDHRGDAEEYMRQVGAEQVYHRLEQTPGCRMLAMTAEPTCYLFPCCGESYTDVTGSGGNVALVKTLNRFKDYLEYAGVTHLYAERGFLEQHQRAEDIIRFMREDGSITPLICQEGNTLYVYHAGIRD